jgi:phosphoribosylanthranilate isomerase
MRAAVKICGLTREEDARLAVELGARFIGLNFYPPSPRCLGVEEARKLAAAVAGRAQVVGVFVDRPAAEVAEIARRVGLDLLQFHGDEGPEALAPFGGRAIKVFRSAGGDLAALPLAAYPEAWGFLFDIRHPSLYGGTGIAWPYRSAARLTAERRVLLAGGIGPGNARQALTESGAFGIDVCSGVERAPGIKDPQLLERLFDEVNDGRQAPAAT